MMTSTTYQVTGMTCEHCVKAVTEELTDLPGVSAVTVTLVPGGASAVTVTSEAPLPADQLADALDEAGGYRLAGTGTGAGTRPDTGTRPGTSVGRAADQAGFNAPSAARTLPVV
jgi:copper chaperone